MVIQPRLGVYKASTLPAVLLSGSLLPRLLSALRVREMLKLCNPDRKQIGPWRGSESWFAEVRKCVDGVSIS